MPRLESIKWGLAAAAEPPAAPKILPVRSIVDLIESDLPALPCWIGQAVLPKGGKWLLGGEAKIGKSFLCMEVCRALATGGRLFNSDSYPVERATVLYVDQEVGEAGLKERCTNIFSAEDLQAMRERFLYVSKSPDLLMDTRAGLEVLHATVERHRPNVLVLDPASRLIEGDQSDGTVVRHFWRNVDKLIKDFAELGLAVVVAHHFRKPPSSRDDADMDDDERFSAYRFTGSADWYNAPDTITSCIRADREPGKETWLLTAKHDTRHGPLGKLLHLRLSPKTTAPVSEIPEAEAQIEYDAIREKREAKKQRRKDTPEAPGEEARPTGKGRWGNYF